MKNWYVYILQNNYEPHQNRTYCGYTNNLDKRLKQHNGIIKGGAKYTTAFGNKSWKFFIIIKGITDKKQALQLEWKIKHFKKNSNGLIGKANVINTILQSKKWKKINLHVLIDENFIDLINYKYVHILK